MKSTRTTTTTLAALRAAGAAARRAGMGPSIGRFHEGHP
jgi:hypothetical protein